MSQLQTPSGRGGSSPGFRVADVHLLQIGKLGLWGGKKEPVSSSTRPRGGRFPCLSGWGGPTLPAGAPRSSELGDCGENAVRGGMAQATAAGDSMAPSSDRLCVPGSGVGRKPGARAQLYHFLAAGPRAVPPASRSLRCHLCNERGPVLRSQDGAKDGNREHTVRPARHTVVRSRERDPFPRCAVHILSLPAVGQANGAGSQDHRIPVRAGTGGRQRVSPAGHSVRSDKTSSPAQRRLRAASCSPSLQPRHGSSLPL